MSDISQQIEAIEKEIRETPYHKGTEHHIGKLRARLARLKDTQIEAATKSGGGGKAFAVKKQGDATVVLVGPPSVGKSTLLNKLTNAESKVASYAFTTVSIIPGMLKYKDAYIQILDVPGLIEGARQGKGRGKEILSVARASDLLFIMTDIDRVDTLKKMKEELEGAGIRIDKKPPEVTIDKKAGGGLIIHSNIEENLSKEIVKEIAREFGIKNAEIIIKEKLTIDRLIDAFSPSRVYIPALFVLNKIDLDNKILPRYSDTYQCIGISAERGIAIEKLKEEIWTKLRLIRVYLVHPDEEPSFKNPIIMRTDQTLEDVAAKIGSEFAEGKTFAKIWGEGSKFPGQEVSLSSSVLEGMQVRFV